MSNLVRVPKNQSLSKINHISDLPNWSDWVDDIFNRNFPSIFTDRFNSEMSLPKVNIKESDDQFEIQMAIPGFSKNDFIINLDDGVLSISAEVENNIEDENEYMTHKEFNYSSFKRTFSLPDSVNDTDIQAVYEDGILRLTLPKKEEAKKKPARSIEIS